MKQTITMNDSFALDTNVLVYLEGTDVQKICNTAWLFTSV